MKDQKHKYKVKPTQKQRMAFNLLKANPRMKLAEAMRRSGYSEKSLLNPGRVLLKSRAIEQVEDKWLEILATHGIHMQTLAEKYAKLFEAKKSIIVGKQIVEVDDNELQFKIAESIKKDLGVGVKDPTIEEKSITYKWRKPLTA